MPSIKELKNRIEIAHSFFWILFLLSQPPIPGRHLIFPPPLPKCLLRILYLKYNMIGNSLVFAHWGISTCFMIVYSVEINVLNFIDNDNGILSFYN